MFGKFGLILFSITLAATHAMASADCSSEIQKQTVSSVKMLESVGKVSNLKMGQGRNLWGNQVSGYVAAYTFTLTTSEGKATFAGRAEYDAKCAQKGNYTAPILLDQSISLNATPAASSDCSSEINGQIANSVKLLESAGKISNLKIGQGRNLWGNQVSGYEAAYTFTLTTAEGKATFAGHEEYDAKCGSKGSYKAPILLDQSVSL